MSKREEVNGVNIKELSDKLNAANDLLKETVEMQHRNQESMGNQIKVMAKQSKILELKLKFIKECAVALVKQKAFILEDMDKSKESLMIESQRIEEQMLKGNDDGGAGEYLISVKKAIK